MVSVVSQGLTGNENYIWQLAGSLLAPAGSRHWAGEHWLKLTSTAAGNLMKTRSLWFNWTRLDFHRAKENQTKKKPHNQKTPNIYIDTYIHIYAYIHRYIHLKNQALGSSEILKTRYIPCRWSCDILVIFQLNKSNTCFWESSLLLGRFFGNLSLRVFWEFLCVHACKVRINKTGHN